ncbi:non-specific serine/threonine protein kinase [Entamoeba marina]
MTNVLKTGFMVKEGSKIKNWKKRWFVFRSTGMLEYYTDKKNTEDKKRVMLEISLDQNKLFRLAFDSNATREEWANVIQKFITDKSTPQTVSKPKPKLEDFETLKLIGKGTYGKVMLVKKIDTEKIYAMKILDKRSVIETNEIEHTMAEREVLGSIDNPFIVQMHYSFQSENKLYFVMDFVNGGELFYHLQNERRFSIARSKFYSAEILIALEHLHQHGVIYRDLKPENVLLTAEGHICLTDFGLSKTGMAAEDEKTGTFCGTAAYLAPEIFAVDWWSFGILTYEMMVGIPPFYCEEEREMYQNIVNESVRYPPNTPASIKTFIDGLLEKNPMKRLTDPSTMKAHPFFQGIDFDLLEKRQLTPPYIPNVKSEGDVSNIDAAFLAETEDAIKEEKQPSGPPQQFAFKDFTYISDK